MKNFAVEFHNLSLFYVNLAEDLKRILNSNDPEDNQTLVNSIIQHRETLEKITGMNPKIEELSEDWARCRPKLEPADRDKADEMASYAKSHAVLLQELCRIHTQRLQSIHDQIRNGLMELGKGARFAKVLKPARHNYPKFIDSCY